MTLEKARQLLKVQADFGGFYNANGAKLILAEVQREHGQEAVDGLIDWLAGNTPADDGRVGLVHGDYRIDNMIFDARAPRGNPVMTTTTTTTTPPPAHRGIGWQTTRPVLSRSWAANR